MKLIKYFNKIREFKEVESTNEEGLKETVLEENSRIEPLEYETTDKEFEYWLDVIKKSYGMHGDITFEDVEEVKEPTELDILKKQVLETQSIVTDLQYKSLLGKEVSNNVI